MMVTKFKSEILRSNHSYNFCVLNLVLVVYTSKMSVKFVLSTLESAVTMGTLGTMESSTIPALDVSAIAVFQVTVSEMKAVFKYQTDSFDFTDTNEKETADIKYSIDESVFPAFNPANAMMDAADSSGAIATADISSNKLLVAHDYVRYLAKKLFNTYHGVDLFNNEKALLDNLRLICGDAEEGQTWKDVMDKLTAVGLNGTHDDIQGTAGAKYMTNYNTSSENICRVLFNQMVDSAITRFSDHVADSTEFQPLPFEANDSISFKLTISPAPEQELLTGVSVIEPRSYEIRFLIVPDSDGDQNPGAINTEVAEDE